MNIKRDPTSNDLERKATQLYAMAKKEELLGRFERAGRLRAEADQLASSLPAESAERAMQFYRAPGNLLH